MRVAMTALFVCLMSSPLVAQIPPVDSVCFWIDGTNLTVYIDSTSNPDDQNKLTTLEIQGTFNEAACDFDTIYTGDFDVCTATKIAKVRARGFGPEYNLGDIIPSGTTAANAAETWIVDGSYLTGGTLDKYGKPVCVGPIPEPSALALLALGTLGLMAVRRRCVR